MRKAAWLLYGPPGCGKSSWIEKQANLTNSQLYHWNARSDRTLREGREMLHQQVRSQNPIFVWVEGADDLTPEAQAFLRRILETSAPNVQCILECRDPSRISPAIQSRCQWKTLSTTTSYRKKTSTSPPFTPSSLSLHEKFLNAEDPISYLKIYLNHENSNISKQAILSLRAVGSGSSAWAQLAYLECLVAAAAKH